MSEYWKSTPKYWCKYCAVYVRDTKIERANHESTGKHQGAIKRSLRDLHRAHDRDERDKERAKREIDRLNGVFSGGASSSSSSAAAGGSAPTQPSSSSSKPTFSKPTPAPAATEASLKKQREQLAELGIAVPGSMRPEMAMPGEWTVTSTRVVETRPEGGEEGKVESRATGVRKREENEEEREEEAAMQGLFKKPKRWGRDSKAMPREQEDELDALLSGSLVKKQPNEAPAKDEGEQEDGVKKEEGPVVKDEPDTETSGVGGEIKTEDGDAGGAVVFKKRKPKGLRTK